MSSAIKMAWEHGAADLQSRFDKSTAQAQEMKEGSLRVLCGKPIEHIVVFHIKGRPSPKSAGRQSVTTVVTPGTLLISRTSSFSDTERAKAPSTWTSPLNARTVTAKSRNLEDITNAACTRLTRVKFLRACVDAVLG